eukprot:evm.model.scf_1679.1 EVM.evm.TU.scf_1679.1   scf_1679:21815-23352(-)
MRGIQVAPPRAPLSFAEAEELRTDNLALRKELKATLEQLNSVCVDLSKAMFAAAFLGASLAKVQSIGHQVESQVRLALKEVAGSSRQAPKCLACLETKRQLEACLRKQKFQEDLIVKLTGRLQAEQAATRNLRLKMRHPNCQNAAEIRNSNAAIRKEADRASPALRAQLDAREAECVTLRKCVGRLEQDLQVERNETLELCKVNDALEERVRMLNAELAETSAAVAALEEE